MEFYTKYKPYKVEFSKSGSKEIDVYDRKFVKNGAIEVYKKGKENVYDKIQASAESVNINIILQKYVNTGDESILHQCPGAFLDLTEMPIDRFEMLNQIKDSKEMFAKLPADVRAKFDNDFNKFIAQTGSNKWFNDLGFIDKNKDGIINKDDYPDKKPEQKPEMKGGEE